MSFEGLVAHGAVVAERAERRTKERILKTANLPTDVDLSITQTGLQLSGRRLRRRMIDDPRLRNFAR